MHHQIRDAGASDGVLAIACKNLLPSGTGFWLLGSEWGSGPLRAFATAVSENTGQDKIVYNCPVTSKNAVWAILDLPSNSLR